MMKHKVCGIEGALLDAAVALVAGVAVSRVTGDPRLIVSNANGTSTVWAPSTQWSQGGPIIEREFIGLRGSGDGWGAWTHRRGWGRIDKGRTPLIAAMRSFVAAKFDDWIDLE